MKWVKKIKRLFFKPKSRGNRRGGFKLWDGDQVGDVLDVQYPAKPTRPWTAGKKWQS